MNTHAQVARSQKDWPPDQRLTRLFGGSGRTYWCRWGRFSRHVWADRAPAPRLGRLDRTGLRLLIKNPLVETWRRNRRQPMCKTGGTDLQKPALPICENRHYQPAPAPRLVQALRISGLPTKTHVQLEPTSKDPRTTVAL